MARALRFQAGVPLQFWGFCVTTAVYILNRLPTVLLQGHSAFEKLFGQVPNLQHLRVFGSLCYATDPITLDKFAPRAVPAVHMGYSMTKKGYILYNLTCKSFFISRDTVLKEDIFPFKNLKSFLNHLSWIFLIAHIMIHLYQLLIILLFQFLILQLLYSLRLLLILQYPWFL